MVDVSPFRGIHYRGDALSPDVLAPPYDVISPAQHEALLARHPHNVVRLILPVPGEGGDWHARAATTLQEWRARDVLVRDAAPALYGYRQRFSLADGQTLQRTGFLARVRLAEWGSGIHRHEHTRAGPRADRLRLMRATDANLSPVFGLYGDPEGAIAQLLGPAERPLLDGDVGGVHETLWRVDAPATVGRITAALAQQDIVIADGHHRYETALAYRDERRAAEGGRAGSADGPYEHVLMYLTAAEDPGLLVLPTHRVISGVEGLDTRALLTGLDGAFDVRAVPEGTSLEAAAHRAAQGGNGRGSVAIGACLAGAGRYVLTLRDLATAHAAAHDDGLVAELDVSVLQGLILAPLVGVTRELLATAEHVSYTISEEEACDRVRTGAAQAAFILNPTTVGQILSAAKAGVTMPQKSTYFYPKLSTGLVVNPLQRE